MFSPNSRRILRPLADIRFQPSLLRSPCRSSSVLLSGDHGRRMGKSNHRKVKFPTALVNTTRFISSGRSRRGLYDGKDIRAGNNVSFSHKKTRRTFKPNVFIKRVYSETLQSMIRFHLTTSTLRSIDKAGGLDNYLLKNEFTEGEGFVVKRKILRRLKNNQRREAKTQQEATTTSLQDGV